MIITMDDKHGNLGKPCFFIALRYNNNKPLVTLFLKLNFKVTFWTLIHSLTFVPTNEYELLSKVYTQPIQSITDVMLTYEQC